ncbi:MAG: phosphoglucosamine mutase [Dehalococcoidales bacterium]
MKKRLFGTSGIRGLADQHLLKLALEVGLALGGIYPRMVIATDTRTSSDAMKRAVQAGIVAAGSSCADAGLMPTPTLALAGRGFDAGVMITASHNPPEYNGIKLLNPDGCAFSLEQQQQLEEAMADGSPAAADWVSFGNVSNHQGAIESHTDHILNRFESGAPIKVVLDCGCGAASVITPGLLERMGCQVMAINCNPSGFFPRAIEPVAANLGDLMKAVTEFGAALGIAHDGDADRMMAVDDKGNFISGDRLLVLLAREMGATEVVTTVDASMAVEESGLEVIRTAVGDNHISWRLKEGGRFGGEPSGSWVFPQVSLCPDGIFAAAQLVDIARRHRLSRMIEEIPSYHIIRGSTVGDRDRLSQLEQRLESLKATSVDKTDGHKLLFEDGWLLIRPSGTEPKIRLTAEAKTEARAREIYEAGLDAVRQSLAEGEEG